MQLTVRTPEGQVKEEEKKTFSHFKTEFEAERSQVRINNENGFVLSPIEKE